MSSPSVIPIQLKAVFAYLDTLLSTEQIEQSKKLTAGLRSFGLSDEPPVLKELSSVIDLTFRLQLPESPVRLSLASYNLFHHQEMADALAIAYGLRNRGKCPVEALNWHHPPPFADSLVEEDIRHHQEKEAAEELSFPVWKHFRRVYEEGDLFYRYDTLTVGGHLLLRNGRLVWMRDCIRKVPVFPPGLSTIDIMTDGENDRDGTS